jgi:hypothetical protein
MHKERARQRRVQSLVRSIWVVAGLAVGAVALVIAVSPRALPTVTIPTPVPRSFEVEGKSLGSAGAPVLLEEFSDFQ